MEINKRKPRIRKFSTWMSDTAKAIEREDEIFAGKKIVLKILRYMEENNISQKQLAEKLGVTPQYINKFLHGMDCDIKISTAIRYGKILNLKLIDIPDTPAINSKRPTIMYTIRCKLKNTPSHNMPLYDSFYEQPYKYN